MRLSFQVSGSGLPGPRLHCLDECTQKHCPYAPISSRNRLHRPREYPQVTSPPGFIKHLPHPFCNTPNFRVNRHNIKGSVRVNNGGPAPRYVTHRPAHRTGLDRVLDQPNHGCPPRNINAQAPSYRCPRLSSLRFIQPDKQFSDVTNGT